MPRSPGLVYTGVPVRPTQLLPTGTFTPALSVTNFADTPAEVTVQFAATSGEATEHQTVLKTDLQARNTRTFLLRDLNGDVNLQNSFIVRSSAPPGTVLSKLVAESDGTLREFELLGKDENQMEDAGGHPWSVENGIASTMFLFNHSGQPQDFKVRVANDRLLWLKVYKLKSMETKAISINDLISSQEKDDHGNVLPKDVAKGEASWLSPATTLVAGRILQSERSQRLARNFSCGTCDYLCGSPSLIPYASLVIGLGNQGLLGTITPDYCNLPCQYYTSCPNVSNPTSYGSAGLVQLVGQRLA